MLLKFGDKKVNSHQRDVGQLWSPQRRTQDERKKNESSENTGRNSGSVASSKNTSVLRAVRLCTAAL